jgi:hypothetical protein
MYQSQAHGEEARRNQLTFCCLFLQYHMAALLSHSNKSQSF